MKANLSISLGGNQLQLSAEGDDRSIIEQLHFWSELPTQCNNCDSGNIGLMFKRPKGNEYYGLRCNACTAELTFHQRKEGGFYLTADDRFEVYGGRGVMNPANRGER